MKRLVIGCLAIGLFPSLVAADEFILASRDLAPAPIIVFRDASPRTRDAVATLADAIEKICGARPEVLDGAPRPLPDRAIWVGCQPAVKELFPQLDLEFQHPEEILIAVGAKHVLIAGRDRWDPLQMDVEGPDGKITGKQQEYGTANAVFTFLQDKLGVRWLWPGELGEDVVPRRTIRLAGSQQRHHPRIRSRGGIFHFSSLGNKGYGRAHDWTRLQRLQLHSLEIEGGHAFSTWWERYHAAHPEVFALQPDGTRSGYPGPRTVKICESNPKVWELWLNEVAEKLARDPTRTVFNASPNDGWYSGHCVCENCTAWDHPGGEPRPFLWQNHQAERPALTDRDVTFANRLGQLLRARYPGKDYYVLMLSYGHSRPAPVKARPADNVIISSVANFFGRTDLVDRGSTRNVTHRQQFEAWGKLAPHLAWRPNTGSPGGWQQGLPDLSVAQTIRDFKDVAAANCIGVFIDSVWEHWATQGPQYYVMAQLAWDPDQDARAILDDYYRRGFGPAAVPVRAYFEMWEQARMAYVAEHGYEAGALGLPKLYTDELLRRADEQLRLAEEKAGGAPSVYRQRVQFVRAGLTWTRLAAENARLMGSYWRNKDEATGAKVRANWETMEQLCKENPYAVNWGPVRPSTPRMLGLHPDYPNPKWKRKQLNGLDLN